MTAEPQIHSKDVRTAAPIPQWLQTALYRRYGVASGWALGNRVCARCAELLALPSPFVDPRERAFAVAEILPLVALYQTLLADGLTADAAETEVRRARAQRLRERSVRGLALAAHAPGRRFWLRRLVQHEVMAAFPTPTFRLETTQTTADTLEFEVKRCPYGAALAAYGAPELLATFCRLDEVHFDVLASAVTCQHQQNGESCRFCFHLNPDRAALEEAQAYLEL